MMPGASLIFRCSCPNRRTARKREMAIVSWIPEELPGKIRPLLSGWCPTSEDARIARFTWVARLAWLARFTRLKRLALFALFALFVMLARYARFERFFIIHFYFCPFSDREGFFITSKSRTQKFNRQVP